MKTTLILFILSVIVTRESFANTCSRLATINYQEVLVDVSSNRGEGLRYYLEKDPLSKELLDKYQTNNKSTWKKAALSTVGSAMILGGFLRSNEGENETFTGRNSLLFGGAILIAVSYLITKTNQYNNEYLLLKSIDEYNKRNTPKIFFSPDGNQEGVNFGVGFEKEF
jgi:hypothetical protein